MITFKLEELCARVLPIEQQGFLRGRRVYAAHMSLYALIEQARLKGERLFVAFVDVKKAFPSVRRDILFMRLSALGASDALVRAVWALYEGACAVVRGADGFSDIFDLEIGTREGGVESPLLFVLFVCDLMEHLGRVPLDAHPALRAGRAVRALQLADGLALIANTWQDLQALLNSWEHYCDKTY